MPSKSDLNADIASTSTDTSTSSSSKRTPPPEYTEMDPYDLDESPGHRLRTSSFSLGLPQTLTPTGSLRGRPTTAHVNVPQMLSTPESTPHLTPKHRAMEKLEMLQQQQEVKERALTLTKMNKQPPPQVVQQGGESTIQGMKGLIPMTMMNEEDDDMPHPNGLMNQPYSIDTDPLLQDNKEYERRAFFGFLQHTLVGMFVNNRDLVGKIMTGIFLVGYTIYLGFAIAYSPYGAIAPCVFTALVLIYWVYHKIKHHFGKTIEKHALKPFGKWWDDHWYIFKWFVYPAPIFMLIIYLSMMVSDVKQLQSISGFVFFFCCVWLTSRHPDKVVWRPVLWGYTLQFVMGLFVLQWEYGYMAVEWLADYVTKIINFGYQGAAVIYGDPSMILHPFVMMGLSLLIYVGAVMAILYHYGITQLVAAKLAWVLASVMGTTAIETMGVSANILLNGMDVMLMLRPYLMKLTISEFNCFLVGGNATIAGFMFGLLILFGAPPQHLLSAAVMSAPATIAIAKLNWPETTPEKSITRDVDAIRLSRGSERNVFEAAANGSAIAGRTVATVVVNYISFMSILYFVDATLSWLGGRVGYTELDFEWICSYVFYPIALLIGIDISQCRQVAKVIGLKVLTTEVYSYQRLGQLYDDGLIDDRSKALGTYALCGFCSMSTIAIAVGVWEVVCEPRRPVVSKLMFRVMFQANISCFTTACVAGLFYSDKLAIFDNDESPASNLITWFLDQIPKLLS